MAQCTAEYHSKDGEDSLTFSSHTLTCMLEEGHKQDEHVYYGMKGTPIDNSINCDCPRCKK